MVPYDTTSRRIVMTKPGPGTGDTVYVDEYGGEWISVTLPIADQTAPPTIGTVRGNRILTGKHR